MIVVKKVPNDLWRRAKLTPIYELQLLTNALKQTNQIGYAVELYALT